MTHYELYGLRIISSTRFPLLQCSTTQCRGGEVYVSVERRTQLPQEPPSGMINLASQFFEGVQEPHSVTYHSRDWYLMRLAGVDYYIATDGTAVRCVAAADTPSQLVWHWFQGRVFSVLLHIHGVFNIHSSAVVCDGRAIAFAGDSYAGKSTLALSFLQSGYRVLTDDVLPLSIGEHAVTALPSYPSLKLREGTKRFFFGNESHSPELVPDRSKVRVLSKQVRDNFRHSPAPLAAIFRIRRRPKNIKSGVGAVVRFDHLKGIEAIRTMADAVFTLPCLERGLQAQCLKSCGTVSTSVPLLEMEIAPGLDLLPDVRTAILALVETL